MFFPLPLIQDFIELRPDPEALLVTVAHSNHCELEDCWLLRVETSCILEVSADPYLPSDDPKMRSLEVRSHTVMQ